MSETKKRIWILVDPLQCSGCRLCEIACSLAKENKIWPEASRIRVFEYLPGASVPHLCVQCQDYPCVEVCPTKCLSVDEETGAVIVDEEKCIQCGLCIDACPGDVPRIPMGKSAVVICDLCGGDPACVKACRDAGYNALKIVEGTYRPIYKTYAIHPFEKSRQIASKLYETEEV